MTEGALTLIITLPLSSPLLNAATSNGLLRPFKKFSSVTCSINVIGLPVLTLLPPEEAVANPALMPVFDAVLPLETVKPLPDEVAAIPAVTAESVTFLASEVSLCLAKAFAPDNTAAAAATAPTPSKGLRANADAIPATIELAFNRL